MFGEGCSRLHNGTLSLPLLHAHIVKLRTDLFSFVCVHVGVARMRVQLPQLRRHLSRGCFSLYEAQSLASAADSPVSTPFLLSECDMDWKPGTQFISLMRHELLSTKPGSQFCCKVLLLVF